MIYALLAATLFAFVDIAWRRILPRVSIWRALFWRSLASSFLLLATALLWEDLSGLTAWSGVARAAGRASSRSACLESKAVRTVASPVLGQHSKGGPAKGGRAAWGEVLQFRGQGSGGVTCC